MDALFPTRTLDPETEPWFFYERFRPAADVLLRIRPLALSFTAQLWREIAAGRWQRRTLQRLSGQHWVHLPHDTGPNWYLDWNNPTEPGPVVDFLRLKFPWPSGSMVVILKDDQFGYQLDWETFLSIWRTFVYDEDGLLLLRVRQPDFGYFGDAGVLYRGQRPSIGVLDADETLHKADCQSRSSNQSCGGGLSSSDAPPLDTCLSRTETAAAPLRIEQSRVLE